ncbi:SpoIIAA family protein [Microvirga roseola]|uniref:STAS/SEC14 domain-containing protein n=1 Tax=Microvirga roseola TaxID=2883126 RepID=UPI001E430855|nr:STAS/SEC14 domain-containing protein [Microvirga roseola]
MLEILPAPDAVLAMRASGRIDEADIERAILAVDNALATRDRIAVYAEIGINGMTPGALACHLSYGFGKLRELHRFPRAAVVTGQDWVRWVAQVEQAVLPGIEVKIFPPAEKDAALAWASEPLPPPAAEPEPVQPSIRPIGTTKPDLVAFEVDGRIGAEDMRRLIATFNQAMDEHHRLRVLVRVRDFDGVTLDALRQEGLMAAKMRGWGKVERYALVGGPAWMEGVTASAAPFVGIQTRRYELADEAQAWSWLGGEPADGGNQAT